jgi:two-component system sensor histidine kinase KdpD
MRILPQRVSWDEILLTATAQMHALAPNHQLFFESQPDLPLLKVDIIRVPQVLTNLVNNAVKYSPQNSSITISAVRDSNEFVKISVSDHGFGIPPEARNRIFEPFQQLERERAGMKGAGLGLAICRGLIDAHGGRIWVDEHDGQGATISFTLPVNMD